MFKNKYFIFIMIISALISISAVSAEDSSISINDTQSGVVVSDESDLEIDYSGEISEPKSFDDLSGKISTLNEGDTLILDSDYKYAGSSGFSGITIGVNNVTIDGQGHTLDANNNGRIFQVTANNVVLKNLTFINGNENYDIYGGAIYARGANLTISDSVFVNNTAFVGGAIYYYNSVNGSILSTAFYNNNANFGGAVYSEKSDLTAIGNIFNTNSANFGGAIYLANSKVFSAINNFENNSGTTGGAIYIDENSHDSSIIMSILKGNTASIGGGIYTLANNVRVIYSTFADNLAFQSYNKGNSINVKNGYVISHGNVFNGGMDFVAPFSDVYGNTTFLNIDVQSAVVNNTTETITTLVKAMRIDDNTYMVEKYSASWNPQTALKENVEEISTLVNQSSTDISSVLHALISMEDNVIANVPNANSTFLSSIVMDVHNDDDLKTAIKYVQGASYNNQKIDCVILNLESNHVFGITAADEGSLFNVGVSYLILNGDNTKFNVVNFDEDNEYHFIYNAGSTVVLSSLSINGFNTAIENHGILSLIDTNFTGNKLDYVFEQDFGGAIKNFGYVSAQNCSFIDNYAKYGGAIYNRGYVDLVNCSFSNNYGYGAGNDVYNFEEGVSNLTNTQSSVFYDEGLSNFEKWALRIGAGVIAISVGILINCVPFIGTAISFWLAVGAGAIGGAIFAGEAVLEGYYNHNINLKQVLISAAIGFGIGFGVSLIHNTILESFAIVEANPVGLGITVHWSMKPVLVGIAAWAGVYGVITSIVGACTSSDDQTNATPQDVVVPDVGV